MIDIVLVEPEIPSNTGNIARTCAATGARLHLIRPLGFSTSDKAVKRAGLDYWNMVDITQYNSFEEFIEAEGEDGLILATTKAPRDYTQADMSGPVKLVFGKETKGLPQELRDRYQNGCVRLPMQDGARSLNLANSVAVLCYEALRQQGFPGLI